MSRGKWVTVRGLTGAVDRVEVFPGQSHREICDFVAPHLGLQGGVAYYLFDECGAEVHGDVHSAVEGGQDLWVSDQPPQRVKRRTGLPWRWRSSTVPVWDAPDRQSPVREDPLVSLIALGVMLVGVALVVVAGALGVARFRQVDPPAAPTSNATITFSASYPVVLELNGRAFPPETRRSLEVPAGTYRIRVSSVEGFAVQDFTHRLAAGEVMTVPISPTVPVRYEARPANCLVTIDGRSVSKPPGTVQLVPGIHEFSFTWGKVTRSVTFRVIGPVTVRATQNSQTVDVVPEGG